MITKTLKIQLKNALQISAERPSTATKHEQFEQEDGNGNNDGIPKSWTIEQIVEIALLATQVVLRCLNCIIKDKLYLTVVSLSST